MAVVKQSWIESANDPTSDFSLQNLPYGVFRYQEKDHIGIAIGDQILDLYACAEDNLFSSLPRNIIAACCSERLNPLMRLGPVAWSALRRQVTGLLDTGQANKKAVKQHLISMQQAVMQLPVQIGDYTDFYASIHHATRVGLIFRPDNPLLPNYKYVPIGYNGRTSSIVVSRENIHRPSGQTKSPTAALPTFGPTRSLDYELEVGIFIGTGNCLGQSIPIAEAEQHIFGLCLLNDWSARDIQSWEYQPLGPLLSKNFATTISPWIVPFEALASYRVSAPTRDSGDPPPLPHLTSLPNARDAIDLILEVYLQSGQMRDANQAPIRLSQGNLLNLYWTIPQLITHHTSNGCNLRPGDLLATGTISGQDAGSEGCLLEKKHNLSPIRLPTGEVRTFLEDGDRIIFRAYTHKPGLPRIGFGECIGTVLA